ncbi:hypothetical protein JCM10213_006007 [Rhodosporidiobolus nylandii]
MEARHAYAYLHGLRRSTFVYGYFIPCLFIVLPLCLIPSPKASPVGLAVGKIVTTWFLLVGWPDLFNLLWLSDADLSFDGRLCVRHSEGGIDFYLKWHLIVAVLVAAIPVPWATFRQRLAIVAVSFSLAFVVEVTIILPPYILFNPVAMLVLCAVVAFSMIVLVIRPRRSSWIRPSHFALAVRELEEAVERYHHTQELHDYHPSSFKLCGNYDLGGDDKTEEELPALDVYLQTMYHLATAICNRILLFLAALFPCLRFAIHDTFPSLAHDTRNDLLSTLTLFSQSCLGLGYPPFNPNEDRIAPPSEMYANKDFQAFLAALDRVCIAISPLSARWKEVERLFGKAFKRAKAEADLRKHDERIELLVLDAVIAWKEEKSDAMLRRCRARREKAAAQAGERM